MAEQLTLHRLADELDYEAPAQMALLKYWLENELGPIQGAIVIAIFGRGQIGKGELIERVWGASPPSSVETCIRVAINKLREKLETEDHGFAIQVRRPSIKANRPETTYEIVRVSQHLIEAM